MYLKFVAALVGSTILCSAAAAQSNAGSLEPSGRWTAHQDGASQTPPMGWSSWNAFKTEIDEEKVIGSAEALVASGLAARDYTYVNVDDGWWLKRRQPDGRLIIRTAISPSARGQGEVDTSFRPFTDRLHAMGLKAGIYSDIGRNACSQAYDLDSPNLPEGSVAERQVGLEGHVEQDLSLFFEEWGFDYIKIDACGLADYAPGSRLVRGHDYAPAEPLIVRSTPARDQAGQVRARYEEVAETLARLNPDDDYVLSICTWGRGDVRGWGNKVGNSWRTSPDISPRWDNMLRSYDSVRTRALYAQPGAWNDPDMLFIGAGDFDVGHLVEARSHFSLWAMVNAPLLIGYDLRDAPQALLDIWGNPDVIAVSQDPLGNQAVLMEQAGEVDILAKSLAGGRKAVALFNRSDRPQTVELASEHLKFAADRPIRLRDLWTGKELPVLQGSRSSALAPHETLLFEAVGSHVLGDGIFLAEMPGRVNIAVEGAPFPQTPTDAELAGPGRDVEEELKIYARAGSAQADASAYGSPLAIAGQGFTSGLGVFANSRLEVLSKGEFSRFVAQVGVDDAARNHDAQVRFLVYGDGQLLAAPDPVAHGHPPVTVDADISGSNVVELVVQSIGDDEDAVIATSWGDARLLR